MSPAKKIRHDAQRQVRNPAHVALLAQGEPMLWLTGAGLSVCILMIVVLLGWISLRGMETFWPADVQRLVLTSGKSHLGEVVRTETYTPAPGVVAGLREQGATVADGEPVQRILVRTGNAELSGERYQWIDAPTVARTERPPDAAVFERLEWGTAFGRITRFAEVEQIPAQAGERLARAEELLSWEPADGADRRMVVARRGYTNGGAWILRDSVSDLGPGERLVGVADIWDGPQAAWQQFEVHHPGYAVLRAKILELRRNVQGPIHSELESARLDFRAVALATDQEIPRPWLTAWDNYYTSIKGGAESAALADVERDLQRTVEDFGAPPPDVLAAANECLTRTRAALSMQQSVLRQIATLRQQSQRHLLFLDVPQQALDHAVPLREIVRGYRANRATTGDRVGVYLSRWWEFLSAAPREANTQGGVFPAIFGTVLMTLLMSIAVVPFGVLAALYLREYARQGLVISTVRIAINNLAGVPSIVYGVFGLGFFCYIVGVGIDELLFSAKLPTPTFGKGGLLWASLTLALMTLPVVIVATEEALEAVPNSMREGSYACGASKWQTIRRIVLPRALPGILTGAILAMARGAGEVAPLMLVGAVKSAPELPIAATAPFGVDRSFMHLGFHIFDLGFQSEDAESARPMVYTTTLLLILIIALLTISASILRNRLRRRFETARF